MKRKIVRGESIKIGSHEVTPEAEVISWQKKEAIVGERSTVPMWGVSFTRIRPTALVDTTRASRHSASRSGETERRIKIADRNRQIESILLIAAILLPIVLNAFASLLRRNRSQSS